MNGQSAKKWFSRYEDKAFVQDSFRMVYEAKSDDENLRGNTWVVKKYNESLKETFEKMEETCESQSRKRLHCCHYSSFRSFVDSYMILPDSYMIRARPLKEPS